MPQAPEVENAPMPGQVITASFQQPALDPPVRAERVPAPPGADPEPRRISPAQAQTLGAGLFAPCGSPLAGFPAAFPWSAFLANSHERLPLPGKLDDLNAITLHLDDVDVRKALELLSREGSLNMVVSPGVIGRVTAHFKGVSLDQVIEAILKMSSLVARRENGLLYIYTAAELVRFEDEKLSVHVYHLNYIKSADVEKMVKPLLSPKGKIMGSPPSAVGLGASAPASAAPAGAGGGGGSPGPGGGGGAPAGGAGGGSTTGGDCLASGEVVVIQDRAPILTQIDHIIHELDVQPLQVMIEAVILSVDLTKDHEFGVNFAVVNSAGKVLTVVGNGALLNATAGFSPQQAVTPAGLLNGTAAQGFAADEHGLRFGFTGGPITGFLRAIETLGKVEVLATPRLLVLNKQPAQLQLGDRLGYSTYSQSLVSTTQNVQFIDTGTLLRVRPFISSDGMVRMEVHPERSSGQVVNNIPQTSTAEVTTNVMIPDGATLVIGGLIEHVNQRNQNGVPYLASLPVVGALFRERIHIADKKELIVLLTPRIWNPHAPRSADPHPGASPAPVVIEVRASTHAIVVGEELIYEIRVTNNGQEPLQGSTMSVTFSPGLHPVAADGPTHHLDEHRVLFQLLDTLPSRGQAVYRVRARASLPGWQSLHAQLSSLSLADGVQVEERTEVRAAPGTPSGRPEAGFLQAVPQATTPTDPGDSPDSSAGRPGP